GCGAQHRRRRQCLRAVRSRHVDPLQEQGRPADPGRRRQTHVQPVRGDAGQLGQAPERQEGVRPAVHRLAGVAGGPEGNRQLQDQRRAALLSERQRLERVMRAEAIIAAVLAMTGPAAADTIQLFAAGSLKAALTDVARAYETASGNKVEAKYGPSGLLRNEIAKGARADVFASANMEHPQALRDEKKSGPVVRFVRNTLCALVRPGLKVDGANLLERMLDPGSSMRSSRLAPSTFSPGLTSAHNVLRTKRTTGPLFFSSRSACGCSILADANTSALAPFAISFLSRPDGPYFASTLLPLAVS